jgi:hypothetical protein
MNKTLFLAVVLTGSFAWQTSQAAAIVLNNGNFENDAGQTFTTITGWTAVDGQGVNNSPSNYFANASNATIPGITGRVALVKSDGNNYIQQVLTTSDAGVMDATTFGSYSVSFDFGYRRDGGTNGDLTVRVSLWDTTDNVELAGQDFIITNPGTGTNSLSAQTATLSYNNTLGSVSGDAIALRVTNTSPDLGSQAFTRTGMVDNFVVTAVPEPGACVSLLGGCGVLVGLRRRRR